MSSPRLTITLTGRSVIDPWWARLVQEDVPDDGATLADAAELLDTLYSIDACDAAATTSSDPESATTDDTVETTIEAVACLYDAEANVDVVVRVIRSNPDQPYKLALQGGELRTTETITETITVLVPVQEADAVTLEYPVLGNFSAAWAGMVYGNKGVIDPGISRVGNTLDFGGVQVKSGSISCTYTTEYDRCTVTILGVGVEPGECTARVFYHGLVEELDLQTPDAAEEIGSCQIHWQVPENRYQIECYRDVYVSQRCQCSHDEIDHYLYEEVVSCPDAVIRCPGALMECRHYLGTVVAHEYVECPGDMVEAVSSPTYYKKICCRDPEVPLPQCKERITSWRGGLQLEGGPELYYGLYGRNLRIVPVSPAGGVCGEWTIRQEIRGGSCCDDVPELEWDTTVSPEVMAPDSAAVIAVNGGGTYPYQWAVSGTGFWFENGAKSIETSGNQVRLIAASGSCGSALITVTDGCTTCAGEVRSTAGSWVLVHEGEGGYPGTPPAMMPGTDVRPPFTQHWREGVKGRWKIRQLFLAGCHCYAMCYASRSTYAAAVSQCQIWTAYSACATLADWYAKGYFQGSCFADAVRCTQCGECGYMDDQSYFSYSLGPHSEIYIGTDGWYDAFVGHTAIVQTEVYEWRC